MRQREGGDQLGGGRNLFGRGRRNRFRQVGGGQGPDGRPIGDGGPGPEAPNPFVPGGPGDMRRDAGPPQFGPGKERPSDEWFAAQPSEPEIVYAGPPTMTSNEPGMAPPVYYGPDGKPTLPNLPPPGTSPGADMERMRRLQQGVSVTKTNGPTPNPVIKGGPKPGPDPGTDSPGSVSRDFGMPPPTDISTSGGVPNRGFGPQPVNRAGQNPTGVLASNPNTGAGSNTAAGMAKGGGIDAPPRVATLGKPLTTPGGTMGSEGPLPSSGGATSPSVSGAPPAPTSQSLSGATPEPKVSTTGASPEAARPGRFNWKRRGGGPVGPRGGGGTQPQFTFNPLR